MAETKPITLIKDETILSFLIVLFSTLNDAGEKTAFFQQGQALYIRQKSDDEITKLNFDHKPLEDKIFSWVGNRTNRAPLNLDIDESKEFTQCVHAAYYLMSEKKETEKIDHRFLQIYEQFFKPNSLE